MSPVVETFDVPVKGIGKPDYSRIVAGAKERRGLHLDYGQTLKIFSLVFVPVGTHTAGAHLTIMTDAAASFLANELVGLIIVNLTDGSSGVITANTVNTVTVAALTGGVTNQWNTNDVYYIASVFPWVLPALAPGASQHVIDADTGLPTPYLVPQGYTLTVIAMGTAVTEDAMAWAHMDGNTVLSEMAPGGVTFFENKLVGVSSASVDPTGAAPHTMDVTLTNLGLGNLLGTIDYVLILEEVGSPALPSVKTVKCKWCSHEHEVPNETTNIICPKCGKLFIVYDNTKLRRTP